MTKSCQASSITSTSITGGFSGVDRGTVGADAGDIYAVIVLEAGLDVILGDTIGVQFLLKQSCEKSGYMYVY